MNYQAAKKIAEEASGVSFVYSKTKVPDKDWRCPFCGMTDIRFRYKSNLLTCHHCVRWYNINFNAKEIWRNNLPEIVLTKEEYQDWCASFLYKDIKCEYCGIPQLLLYKIPFLTSDLGKKTSAMGVDRVDSKGPYSINNIVWCCLLCNRGKADLLSYEQAKKHMGPANRRIYLESLGYSMEEILESEKKDD